MKKIKTFYNGNKPFVIIATAFILLGAIFNDKLVNLSDQAAQVFSLTPTNTTPITLPTYVAPPSIYQYPALSKSGFYLENKVASPGNYTEALNSLKSSADTIARDIKNLTVEYKTANCAVITSTLCTDKVTSISNAMYTYSNYLVAYSRIKRASMNVSLNPNTDWAGLTAVVLYSTIKMNSLSNVDSFLNYLSSRLYSEVSISTSLSGVRTYTPPLASEMNTAMAYVLKTRNSTYSQSIIIASNPVMTATSPATASTAAVVTNLQNTIANGVWTARDSARIWSSLASDASGTRLAAVVSNGYIYTSIDSGVTWTQKTFDMTRGWKSITSDASGTRLAATVYGGGIYTSTDGGTTWTPRGLSRNWSSITSDASGTKLAAVVQMGYIYTSTDGGITWAQRDSSRYWNYITSDASGTKLAAVQNGGYIYTSINGGLTWTPRGLAKNWSSITSSSDGMKLAATVYGGYIYTSINGGVTWTQKTFDMLRGWKSITSSSDGTKLAATALNGYIYTSKDSGTTWTAQTSVGSRRWYSIVSDSTGVKLASFVDGGQIYTTPTPSTVVPPILSVSTNPFLFIFGANPLGYTDFKIIGKTTIAVAGDKFGKINGSVGEVNTTRQNLQAISAYTPVGQLMYAEVSTSLNYSFKSSGIKRKFNEIRLSLLDFIFHNNKVVSAQAEISSPNLQALEKKVQNFAKNISSGAIKATGEIGIAAVPLPDGKIIAIAVDGVSLDAGQGGTTVPLSELSDVVDKYKVDLKKIYIYHTHDNNTVYGNDSGSGSGSGGGTPIAYDANGNKVPLKGSIPSSGDLVVNYKTNKLIEFAFEIVEKVIPGQGYGYEYTIPKDSLFVRKYIDPDMNPTYDSSMSAFLEDIIAKNGHSKPTVDDVDNAMNQVVALMREDGVIMKKIEIK